MSGKMLDQLNVLSLGRMDLRQGCKECLLQEMWNRVLLKGLNE